MPCSWRHAWVIRKACHREVSGTHTEESCKAACARWPDCKYAELKGGKCTIAMACGAYK